MSTDLLRRVLTRPEAAASLSAGEWDLLLRQARRANLLPRLALQMEADGLMARLPPPVQPHLGAAALIPPRQNKDVRREAGYIERALAPTGVKPILLKGAAYVLRDLPLARGRIFSDVDILVPSEALPEVEAALMLHGWATTHHNAYDQRYYRQWMHELPPMQHVLRQTVVDVHHAILPRTARWHPDSDKLRADAQPVPGAPGLYTLAPIDMVIHSATHLFHEGELHNGLRDLLDIDDLVRLFMADADFWPRLVARAAELDLSRPLYYALRYATSILSTPVPHDIQGQMASGAPPATLLWIMDALFHRALRPDHPSVSDRWTPAARWLLYVRAHWLRMPPGLLAWHLAVKALRREQDTPG